MSIFRSIQRFDVSPPVGALLVEESSAGWELQAFSAPEGVGQIILISQTQLGAELARMGFWGLGCKPPPTPERMAAAKNVIDTGAAQLRRRGWRL